MHPLTPMGLKTYAQCKSMHFIETKLYTTLPNAQKLISNGKSSILISIITNISAIRIDLFMFFTSQKLQKEKGLQIEQQTKVRAQFPGLGFSKVKHIGCILPGLSIGTLLATMPLRKNMINQKQKPTAKAKAYKTKRQLSKIARSLKWRCSDCTRL